MKNAKNKELFQTASFVNFAFCLTCASRTESLKSANPHKLKDNFNKLSREKNFHI